ncbi:MAG: MoxR family ATPase [Gemmatimonadales bacterium]|nr:MoxR family ATPase [Gemmatimonadota bacterium]MCC7132118.1 MoxR family ATPase [Gemmatimonadales bacterium]MDX2057479.1 MoxR family ATPase [Gemmatimonadales bacterium]
MATSTTASPNAEILRRAIEEVGRRIVGQRAMVERLAVGLLTGGHVLLEGVPGLAKTLAVKTLAEIFKATFSRIQFTPDLLPADIVGTMIFDPKTQEFRPKQGPLFANIVLADEINRAPAKVQSALLEAMQEHQVSIGGQTYHLPEPFLVLATQNPIENEGTYPLPEAQLDRFLLKVHVGYPTRSEEREILQRMSGAEPIAVAPILEPEAVLELRRTALSAHLDPRLADYIVDLVRATREPASVGLASLGPLVAFGASPRASIALAQAARAHAVLQNRGYVTPQDIQALAPDVLRHRIVLSFEAEAEDVTSDAIVEQVLAKVKVP